MSPNLGYKPTYNQFSCGKPRVNLEEGWSFGHPKHHEVLGQLSQLDSRNIFVGLNLDVHGSDRNDR